VTPAQRHRGEDKSILAARARRLAQARRERMQKNRSKPSIVVEGIKPLPENRSPVIANPMRPQQQSNAASMPHETPSGCLEQKGVLQGAHRD